MPFTIPNEADAFNANQAEPDRVDVDIMVAGLAGDGVISGCAVTAQGSPDMTVAVAAGVVKVGTTVVSVSAGNVTIATADATNPRIDLVTADNAGARAAVTGTAAASPVMPAIPANRVVLAAVFVPANDTTIETNQITDKRVLLPLVVGQSIISPSQITANQNNYNPTGLGTATVVRLSADNPFRRITGMATGAEGRALIVYNVGSVAMLLTNEDAASTAGNRFTLGFNYALDPNTSLALYYDNISSRWRSFGVLPADQALPFSPRILSDDFLTQNTEAGEVGLLGWGFTNGTVAAQASSQNRPGVQRRTSGTTANQVASMYLGAAVGTQLMRFDELDEMWFSVALVTTGTDFTVRFGAFADVSGNPPAHGLYIERLSTDTSFFGVSRNNSAETRTAALVGQDTAFHTFRLRRVSATVVGFAVDGGAETQISASNIPDATDGLNIGFQVIPTTTTARSLDVDFFSLKVLPMPRW